MLVSLGGSSLPLGGSKKNPKNGLHRYVSLGGPSLSLDFFWVETQKYKTPKKNQKEKACMHPYIIPLHN